jgi:hypothetical protein
MEFINILCLTFFPTSPSVDDEYKHSGSKNEAILMGSSKQNGRFLENACNSFSQILLIYGDVP